MNEHDFAGLTLPMMFHQTCKRFPERSAIYFKGEQLDYRTLASFVKRFAEGLRQLGIAQGDRVAIMLPNCPQYVVAYYGILQVGGIVVQISPMAVAGELEHYLGDSGAKAIVVFAPLLPVLENVKNARELLGTIVVELPPTEAEYPEHCVKFEALLACSEMDTPAAVRDADVAVLQYTGGTTGRSKGAMLTHRNLVANAYQSHFVMKRREHEEEVEQERILTVIPLFHVYAMTVCMNIAILTGAQMILLPRFDLNEVLATIKETRPTLFPGVPTMYVAVNSHPQAVAYGISSIRLCVSGSAPLPVEVIKEFEEKTEGVIIEGYGLSEASPVTHFNPLEKRKPGSIGTVVPLTEARIVDLQEGTTELGPHEYGELVIRGPQVMSGYWNLPEETARTIRDGWLYTGDIAARDEEGYYYIVDRKKDLIIAGGYNIYPREVEEVLYEHPDVQEAVVIGVPDAYRGETVKAVIVLRQGAALTSEEVEAYCREHLAAYKVPRIIEFREALPKTAVGKILRRLLREESSQPHET
ncbi:long-chain fatty acid--CoA ligase [Brevibacillus sp. SYP-B805]|uniref:long-chain-fatty-acid--CoA ligase n=1 Tax=Brevibacillus sp. SYP-B805 TaxID=1578199 RepID=UPI0013EC4A8B|nr:long-chain fatty acid--CoA ligase [Brevibacillus sp. SYP-B805]NGQ96780.1 long-chain fatty acid--CoA ligase [Brevibacillus sp. SYP-B805]